MQALSNRLVDTRLFKDPDHAPIEGVKNLRLWKDLDACALRSLNAGSLSELDRFMEEHGLCLADLYQAWVLYSDPAMKCTSLMPLNPMFMQACLVAKLCYLYQPRDEMTVQDIIQDHKELEILDTPIDMMSWKEYQLTLQNVQLNWTKFAINPCCANHPLQLLITKLFSRLGFFLSYTFSEDDEGCPLDDLQACTRCPDYENRLRLCDQQIAYCSCLFWSICYSSWLQENAALTQIPEEKRVDIEEAIKDKTAVYHHHIEAGNDFYFTATMYDDIMIGSLLQYMHRFAGMFHSVSQVAYFHNPEYQRRRPPEGVEDLLRERPAIDKVPTLQQIYPDIELFHESTSWDQLPKEEKRWLWVHTPGLVFLVKNGSNGSRDILWNPDPYELLKIYILSLNPMIFMCDSQNSEPNTA